MNQSDETGSTFWINLMVAIFLIFFVFLFIISNIIGIDLRPYYQLILKLSCVWISIFGIAILLRSISLLFQMRSKELSGMKPFRMVGRYGFSGAVETKIWAIFYLMCGVFLFVCGIMAFAILISV